MQQREDKGLHFHVNVMATLYLFLENIHIRTYFCSKSKIPMSNVDAEL